MKRGQHCIVKLPARLLMLRRWVSCKQTAVELDVPQSTLSDASRYLVKIGKATVSRQRERGVSGPPLGYYQVINPMTGYPHA